jgi:diadenosine tetraphosphatase ApaH/serine/threonine PP2A family protein phosphatase
MDGLAKIKDEVLKAGQEATRRDPGDRGWNPGSRGSGQDSRPKREAAQKAMDALKKGADATRGRGRRKGRMYQRAGIRN